MRVICLQSGSNGNCMYVEAGGKKLLFDAGMGKQAAMRLESFGADINDVDAVLISHDHVDHVRCAGIYARKFGLGVWITDKTRQASRVGDFGRGSVHSFEAGKAIDFGTICVQTLSTPHDASDGVAFVVDDGQHRLGILTDLGHCFAGLGELVATLDAVIIESNYDPRMLAEGPYPLFLQERIRGPHGHLSNFEAAELVRDWASPRLKWACLGHLSQHNNLPELALATARKTLGQYLPICAASRYEPVGPMEL